jgi:hypothetical protein|uniref:FtsL-like putative cell division protein n=1 Tax=Polaribacter sp. TaxID=1920175 RepID=UPI0040474CB6
MNAKVRKNVYDILRGSFLTDESAFKNWRIIIFIVVLLLVMISSGHRADGKVQKIATLNKLQREVRAEYIDTKTILMRMKMESNIRQRVKAKGLAPAETSPQKIKVTYKKD